MEGERLLVCGRTRRDFCRPFCAFAQNKIFRSKCEKSVLSAHPTILYINLIKIKIQKSHDVCQIFLVSISFLSLVMKSSKLSPLLFS